MALCYYIKLMAKSAISYKNTMIVAQRKILGMNQTEFARWLKRSREFVCELEAGRGTLLGLEYVCKRFKWSLKDVLN